VADGGLLLDALGEALIQAGRSKGGQRVVHFGLLLTPLALEGVGGEQLGLDRGALGRQAGL
jgi:hypothetical protein